MGLLTFDKIALAVIRFDRSLLRRIPLIVVILDSLKNGDKRHVSRCQN